MDQGAGVEFRGGEAGEGGVFLKGTDAVSEVVRLLNEDASGSGTTPAPDLVEPRAEDLEIPPVGRIVATRHGFVSAGFGPVGVLFFAGLLGGGDGPHAPGVIKRDGDRSGRPGFLARDQSNVEALRELERFRLFRRRLGM